jgi:ADP-dependent NAD(P)H-hydrate dehydratase / NAD(P)H-hydrate epimerase
MPQNAWRVADIRAAEQALMALLPHGTLMARASSGLARRCAELLADRFGGVYGRRVAILVGAGDNGGDGLFAGALLARRGVAVHAVLLDRERAHRDGLAALLATHGRTDETAPPAADLVVDGIVGIGGRGGLRPQASALVQDLSGVRAADGARPIVVAVDVPSGVNADTGAVEGDAVRADVTVTFGALKPGLLVGAGARHAGLVDLVDIGLAPHLQGSPALRVPTADDIREWWPKPGVESDKYTRGVVGVATGSSEYTGAALLSVAGACAGPAGMVRYAGGAADLVRAAHPPVIATSRVADAGRVQAWVCGSGLGVDDRAMSEVRAVLATKVPVCLDADALTLIADGRTPQTAELLRERSATLVVTPHDREFARLAGHEPGPDRVDSALDLAAKLRATVLLKGARTVVACPDGTAWVNLTGSAALATGGTGDVLAGLLGSLLAAGLPSDRAAIMAAYAHGLAGRRAAGDTGTFSVTSADVAAALPATIAGLGVTGR